MNHKLRVGLLVLLSATVAVSGCGSSNAGSRQEGKKIEQKLQAGWDQYKLQDEPIMATQLRTFIQSKPTLTQVGAIEAAFEYAQGLTLTQRLQPGAQNELIDGMERDFPATKKILNTEVAHR